MCDDFGNVCKKTIPVLTNYLQVSSYIVLTEFFDLWLRNYIFIIQIESSKNDLKNVILFEFF